MQNTTIVFHISLHLTTSVLRFRNLSITQQRPLSLLSNVRYALFKDVQRYIRLYLIHNQWRTQAYCRLSAAKQQQTTLKGHIDDTIAYRSNRSARDFVLHQLHADHQPSATHIADHRISLNPSLQTFEHRSSHHLCIPHRAAFDDIHRRPCSSDADRVSTKRTRMRSRDPIHDLRLRHAYAQRHTRCDTFGDADDIRLHT